MTVGRSSVVEFWMLQRTWGGGSIGQGWRRRQEDRAVLCDPAMLPIQVSPEGFGERIKQLLGFALVEGERLVQRGEDAL